MFQRRSHEVSGDRIRSTIPEPEPAHLPDEDPSDPREATELQQNPRTQPMPKINRIISAGKPKQHWYDPIKKVWRHQIRIAVPHVDCRDHLANERTFLGYLRTSVAVSMLGVLIAQLWRLKHSPTPDPVFGYYAISKPLAAILQVSALGILVVGSVRFFRQQHSMARGKVHAGGWEIFFVMVFVALLLLTLFVLNVALDIYKQTTPDTP